MSLVCNCNSLFFKHLCAYQIVPVYFVSPEKKTFAEIVEPFIPVR